MKNLILLALPSFIFSTHQGQNIWLVNRKSSFDSGFTNQESILDGADIKEIKLVSNKIAPLQLNIYQ